MADTHLGYRSSTLPGRDEDFSRSWIHACRAIVDSKPDLILHAGDIFHHPHPSWGAVTHFMDGAEILKEAGCPIYMISGNHDTSRLTLKYSIFSILPIIVPHIMISHDSEPRVHYNTYTDSQTVLLSHRALINPNLEEEMKKVVGYLDPERKAILVSHGSVGNLKESRELGSVVIPETVFEYPWDYVALGHLHISQPHGKTGWYSGSTERCGWSDYPASPAWTYTILSDGRISHEQRSVPHLDMIQLPDLYCDACSEVDVIQEILRLIQGVRPGPGRTVIRVLLRDVPPREQRVLQGFAKRAVKEQFPDVVFQPVVESMSHLLNTNKVESGSEKVERIEDLFRKFVENRTYVDPEFADKLLEKGLSALSKAQSNQMDADTGDERSEPV